MTLRRIIAPILALALAVGPAEAMCVPIAKCVAAVLSGKKKSTPPPSGPCSAMTVDLSTGCVLPMLGGAP